MALSVADTLNTELDMTPTAFTQLVTERHTSTEVTEEKYQLLKRRLKEITEKNESLTNDLSRAKKRLRRLAKEKNMLLERICRYDRGQQPMMIPSAVATPGTTIINATATTATTTTNTTNATTTNTTASTDGATTVTDSAAGAQQTPTMHMDIDDSASTVSDQAYEQQSQHSPPPSLPPPHPTHDLSPIPSAPWQAQQHKQDEEEEEAERRQYHHHHPQEQHRLPPPPPPLHPPPETASYRHHPSHHHQQQPQQRHTNSSSNPYHNQQQQQPPTLPPPSALQREDPYRPSPSHHHHRQHHHLHHHHHHHHDRQPNVVPAPPVLPEPPTATAEAPAPPLDSPPLPQPTSNSSSPPSSQGSSSQSSSPARPRVEVMLQDGRMVPSSRPKRMRRGPVEPKMRRVQPLEKDSVSGEYKLPARVGILTVHSLGRVVPLPTYHNDRYIWPPGFKVSRTYLSMVDPNTNTSYTCSVEENGEQGPRFRVVAEDCPDQPIIANSATGVWTAIVKRANEIRHRDHSNSASGPDYYGFTHATIAKMIQDLPGTENCINYVWQKFGVMHQRTAAGVAAAAQKKLTNLEIMGSANKRPPPLHQQDRDDFTIMEHPEEQIAAAAAAAAAAATHPVKIETQQQEPIRLIQMQQSSATDT